MQDPIAATADALINARRSGRPALSAGLTEALAAPEQAFVVQQRVAQALGWQTDPGQPGLWKTGAAQAEGPFLHGELPLAGLHDSRSTLRLEPERHCAVEAEVAFRLRDAVTAEQAAQLRTASDAAELFADVAPAIELVASRWDQGLKAPELLRLADLQSHEALLLGNWYPYGSLDWMHMGVSVRIGERPLVEVRGSHPLRHPTIALLHWLKHATAGGRTLAAGTIATTGSWVGAIPVSPGERVEVSFDAIGDVMLDLQA